MGDHDNLYEGKEMKVVSLNTSKKKGTLKLPVETAEFKIDHGVVGDAHAGPGIRQVSLLAQESIDWFQKEPHIKIPLRVGIFGENITTQGVELHKLSVGDKLFIGDVELELSKIGKECHTVCFIGIKLGDCVMPKEGIFAIVKKEGTIRVGDDIRLERVGSGDCGPARQCSC